MRRQPSPPSRPAAMAAAAVLPPARLPANRAGESAAAEVTTVDYHYVNFGTIAETEPVDDVINEHLESIGSDVRISLHMYDAASYNTQMDLMISSGDPVDLYIPLTGVSTNAAQGKLYDITDIAEANCPNALEMTSDWLDTCTVDGRLYAIPVYKGAMLQNYLIVNKDMADEYGIDPSEYEGQPLSAIEPMLQQIHEANPDIFPVVPLNANAYNFLDFFIGATNGYKIDMLGDRTSTCTGCIVGDDMTVVNLYETDAFRECCELAYDWMQKGYLMPDTSTSPDSASTLMAAGRGFCTTGGYGNSPEMMETNSSLSGNANSSYYVCLEQPYMTTSTIGVTTCVGITSEHPEAALRMLDLFYTDEFVINSILYGVEGRDYVKVTDQTIAFPKGSIPPTFPMTPTPPAVSSAASLSSGAGTSTRSCCWPTGSSCRPTSTTPSSPRLSVSASMRPASAPRSPRSTTSSPSTLTL